MAQFKWLHEIDRPKLVKVWGPIRKLRIPKKDGTKQIVLPADPEQGFQPDEVLSCGGQPIDFTDDRSLRVLRADVRLAEVTT